MNLALGALPHDGLPDEDDLTAGPPSLFAAIRLDDERWHAVDPVAVTEIVMTAVAANPVAPMYNARCDIVFTDETVIADLNGRFRGKPQPTNVLAFPSADARDVRVSEDGSWDLGGLALAFDVMEREANERGISLAHHTTHLTLHGLLHLLGFDHVEDADRERMESIEINVLRGLGIADPYNGS